MDRSTVPALLGLSSSPDSLSHTLGPVVGFDPRHFGLLCGHKGAFGSPATVAEMLHLTVTWSSVEPAAGTCEAGGGHSDPLGAQGFLGPVSWHPSEDPAGRTGTGSSLLLYKRELRKGQQPACYIPSQAGPPDHPPHSPPGPASSPPVPLHILSPSRVPWAGRGCGRSEVPRGLSRTELLGSPEHTRPSPSR